MVKHKQPRMEGHVHATAASGRPEGTPEAERHLRQAALQAAGKHFSADEYHQLETDICAGLVDIRIYDGGLVLTR
jgi:hypothetical protein